MRTALVLSLVPLLGCKKPPPPPPPPPVVIPIAAMNDFHGALYEKPVRDDPQRALGGLPWLAAAVDHLRDDHPDLLLLDGGDVFQGSWPVNASRGQGAVDAFNLLGVDAAAIGNHEFDYGKGSGADSDRRRGALEEAAARAEFQWLSSNIYLRDLRWNPEGTAPFAIVERKGKKIGIIGLTTTDTPQTTLLANVEDLRFENPVAEVEKILPIFEHAGVDVTMVVGHLTGSCETVGYADQGEPCLPSGEIGLLLTELPRGTIDVLVVGHAHTFLSQRWEDTFILENRSKGHILGRLDLVVGPDGVDADASKLLDPWVLAHDAVDPGCEDRPFPTGPLDVGGVELTPDAEAIALVERLEQEAGSLCDPVGCAETTLGRSREAEAAAANVLSDAMFSAFRRVDIAIMNSGGVRADFPAGELRVEHVQDVMPFDNRLLLVELTGKQVELLFQIGSSGAHGILQPSGASYHYDPEATEQVDLDGNGELEEWETDRLCGVTVKGQPLDPEQTYRVVTSDFLYGGGDHFGPVFDGVEVVDEGGLLRDAIVDHLQAQTTCLGGEIPLVNPDAPRILRGSCEPKP